MKVGIKSFSSSFLIDVEDRQTQFMKACEENNVDVLRKLQAEGFMPNVADETHVLCVASRHGNLPLGSISEHSFYGTKNSQ